MKLKNPSKRVYFLVGDDGALIVTFYSKREAKEYRKFHSAAENTRVATYRLVEVR